MKHLQKYKFYRDNLENLGLEKSEILENKKHHLELLTDAILVTENLFPKIYKALELATKNLKLDIKPDLYIKSSPEINGLCHSTKSEKIIIEITSGLIENFKINEISFIIGHEIGHKIFDHFAYPEVSENTIEAHKLNILQLNRFSEISCDRVGLLACKSIDVALKAIIKLASGLSDKHINTNLVQYTEQYKEIRKKYLNKEMEEDFFHYARHPSLPVRARAIIKFEMSDIYYVWVNKKGKAPFKIQDVDELIYKDLKESGETLDIKNNELYSDLSIWSYFKIFSIDNKISKEEQKSLMKYCKPEKVTHIIKTLKQINNPSVAIDKKLNKSLLEANVCPLNERKEIFSLLKKNILSYNYGIKDKEKVSKVLSNIEEKLLKKI